jgi:ankyrin repeat protein
MACPPSLRLVRLASSELHFAAANGKIEDVQRLVTEGTDVNSLDAEGNTPLLLALSSSSLECVKCLLRTLHADPDRTGSAGGKTPLHVAGG